MYNALLSIFSDFSDCSDSLEVYYNGPLEYTYESIYGYYVRQEGLIHGRPWYKNYGKSIWWDDEYDKWWLDKTTTKGSSIGYAYLKNHGRCLPKIPNQQWKFGPLSHPDHSSLYDAGKNLRIRGYKPKGMNKKIIFCGTINMIFSPKDMMYNAVLSTFSDFSDCSDSFEVYNNGHL